MANPNSVTISHVSKSFGTFQAVKDVNLTLTKGEFFSLLGPSGCGKSTLLRMIAGFEDPTTGTIAINDKSMADVPPNRRPTNMVFQSYAIFPHLTVAQNIAFGLSRSGLSKQQIRAKASEMLEKVGLQGLDRRGAHELSGGQRQRVALARALVLEPEVLLLDEPLSALDKKLREQMQMELRQLQRAVGITFLMVTHDQHEAMTISDRCGVMFNGTLTQVATPQDLYQRPINRGIADFIGGMNFLAAKVLGRTETQIEAEVAGFGRVSLDRRGFDISTGSHITIGLRPERMHLSTVDLENADVTTTAVVTDRAFYGETIHYFLKIEGNPTPQVASITNFARAEHFQIGDSVKVGFRGSAAVALPN